MEIETKIKRINSSPLLNKITRSSQGSLSRVKPEKREHSPWKISCLKAVYRWWGNINFWNSHWDNEISNKMIFSASLESSKDEIQREREHRYKQ